MLHNELNQVKVIWSDKWLQIDVNGYLNSLIYMMDQNNKIAFPIASLKETEDEHVQSSLLEGSDF